MGHSSSRVTRDVYGHVLPVVDDAVTVEIDKLFRESFAHGSRTTATVAKRTRSNLPTVTSGRLQWR